MNNLKPWSEFKEFNQKLIDEINKGVDMANEHFKKNKTKAKAHKPINISVTDKAP